ncbi:hypothetical protein EMCRGX_G015608 [Ephydatia muelleri]
MEQECVIDLVVHALNHLFPAAPSAPTITSLISTYSDQITVTWTSVPTATSYNYTFTGLTSNTVYTVSVVAINCAGSSSPATMTGRTGNGPAAPSPLHPPQHLHAQLQLVHPLVQLLVCQSLSPLWCPSLGSVGGFCSLLHFKKIQTKGSSHKPSSYADPVATVYDEVGTNKKMMGDAMEMNTNTAYRSYVS